MSRRSDRRKAAALLLATLLCVLALTLAACGTEEDPFIGLWWQPSTGRRIEIAKDGDAYRFLYGVAKRPYQAMRVGDELRIREPMGGTIVVRATDDGGLELIMGGKPSPLKRVPQHQ